MALLRRFRVFEFVLLGSQECLFEEGPVAPETPQPKPLRCLATIRRKQPEAFDA